MAALDIALLRDENGGALPASARAGRPVGYSTDGGEQLCAECATERLGLWEQEESDDPPVSQLTYGDGTDYPDEDETCDGCSAVICPGPDDRDYSERLEDAVQAGLTVRFTRKP